jgi:hypothetical protein
MHILSRFYLPFCPDSSNGRAKPGSDLVHNRKLLKENVFLNLSTDQKQTKVMNEQALTWAGE